MALLRGTRRRVATCVSISIVRKAWDWLETYNIYKRNIDKTTRLNIYYAVSSLQYVSFEFLFSESEIAYTSELAPWKQVMTV